MKSVKNSEWNLQTFNVYSPFNIHTKQSLDDIDSWQCNNSVGRNIFSSSSSSFFLYHLIQCATGKKIILNTPHLANESMLEMNSFSVNCIPISDVTIDKRHNRMKEMKKKIEYAWKINGALAGGCLAVVLSWSRFSRNELLSGKLIQRENWWIYICGESLLQFTLFRIVISVVSNFYLVFLHDVRTQILTLLVILVAFVCCYYYYYYFALWKK